MKPCILCGKQTEGSIGAAGIKWTVICQICKDKEDKALEMTIKNQAKVLNLVLGGER